MTPKTAFSVLFLSTYHASSTSEPMERYFASMFAGYFDQANSQPGCAAIKAMLRGDRKISRKLLQHYRDLKHPRCPRKLEEDLSSLLDCCFVEAFRRKALDWALEAYLNVIPEADAKDLRQIIGSKELSYKWTCLTWHALCGDHYE